MRRAELEKLRKLSVIVVFSIFMCGLSSTAFAYWAAGDLIRVVYQPNGTVEVATDLGSITTILSSGLNGATNGDNIASRFNGADYGTLKVAYFAYTSTGVWTSGLLSGSQQTTGKAFNTTSTAMGAVLSYYSGLGSGNQTNQGLQSNTYSYWKRLDMSGSTIGGFGGFLSTPLNGESYLTSLRTGGVLLQGLYSYSNTTNSAQSGMLAATLETYVDANGILRTAVKPVAATAVPVPSSGLLISAGLAFLAGLRGRKALSFTR